MTCPFLRETPVAFCQAAGVRKMIPVAQVRQADEKCASAAYCTCPEYRSQADPPESAGHCPYLGESLMQYCGAAPVARMVPYSESTNSRCGSDSHQYCDLYMALAHPRVSDEEVDGIRMPERLSYSANHMWVEVAEDGTCHAGIDAFLARALGAIDRLSYLSQRGDRPPAAVLTVKGVDLQVMFPNPIRLTACNSHLRAGLPRLTADPYSSGWLFEGEAGPGTTRNLLTGAEAREWMQSEQHRMNEFLQRNFVSSPGEALAADGGTFAEGLLRQLDREQAYALFYEFFSPLANEKRL